MAIFNIDSWLRNFAKISRGSTVKATRSCELIFKVERGITYATMEGGRGLE